MKGVSLKTAVIDMQPITPTIGGGRMRLRGLYHNLGENIHCHYVGSYDWPGEVGHCGSLEERFYEEVVPLDARQFELTDIFKSGTKSQTLVDTLFCVTAHVSTAYMKAARAAIVQSDVVVFSHPWAYPLFSGDTGDRLVIYDAQNVESLLKSQGLAANPLGVEILKVVIMAEAQLTERADHVFCCSLEDKNVMSLIYGVPLSKISIVPNGAFFARVPKHPTLEAADPVRGVFIGSSFGPNVAAALSIARVIAPLCPNVEFVLLGGVCEDEQVKASATNNRNVRLVGVVTDDSKRRWLSSATFAVNPVESGSGTNIKMFDFMAAGLPIVTTLVGARGITDESDEGITVCNLDEFPRKIADLLSLPPSERKARGQANQHRARSEFDWSAISAAAGSTMRTLLRSRTPRTVSVQTPAETAHRSRPGINGQSIAIVSTYKIKCGIAGYSGDFAKALMHLGYKVSMIAARTPNEKPNLENSEVTARVGWEWDNVNWSGAGFDPGQVLEGAELQANAILSVQYHTGFFSIEALTELVRLAAARNIRVAVTGHNGHALSPEDTARIHEMGARWFFHSHSECELHAASNATVLPCGILDAATLGHLPIPYGMPTIGTFGFIRKHKGLRNLISAMSVVRSIVPTVKLRAFCAMYPSPDSVSEAEACKDLIRALELEEVIELRTEFLDIQAVLKELAKHHLNVLPYSESDEGASGAASYCLGARVPLVTSGARIFDDLKDSVYRFAGSEPLPLALSLACLLQNAELLSHYRSLANKYVDKNNWQQIARLFSDEISHAPVS